MLHEKSCQAPFAAPKSAQAWFCGTKRVAAFGTGAPAASSASKMSAEADQMGTARSVAMKDDALQVRHQLGSHTNSVVGGRVICATADGRGVSHWACTLAGRSETGTKLNPSGV